MSKALNIAIIIVTLFTVGVVRADIAVTDAKARATFALATTGAAYAEIENTSGESVRLLSVSVPETVAQMAELHTTFSGNGMMKMRKLENGLEIKPGASVSLQPGGHHIMLLGLKGPLNAGTSIQITLNFSNNTSRTIDVPVVDMANGKQEHHHHH